MKSEKEIVEEKIKIKQAHLTKASSEANAWNKGKYKNSSNATISKIYVESIKEEIDQLYETLKSIKNKDT